MRQWAQLGVTVLALLAAQAAMAVGPVLDLAADDRTALEAVLGPGVVGEAVASAPLPAPDAFLTAAPRGFVFRAAGGEDEGETATEKHTFTKADPAQSAAGWTYAVGPDDTRILERAKDGSLATVAEIDREQGVVSHFTPGEPLLIGGMAPGESRTFHIAVQVVDIDDPTDVEHEGALELTFTYVGTFRVTVPAGTFEAPLLHWHYQGKVGPATIDTQSYRFVAPGTGMIAMMERRSIAALLIYRDDSQRGKLLERVE